MALTIPNTFVSGTTISSSQVNANFSSVQSYVNGQNIGSANIVNASIGASGYSDLASHIAGTGLTLSSNQLSIANGAITQAMLQTRPTGTSVAAGGVATSASSGLFQDNSGNAVDVTGLTVTLVSTGRPVFIGLIPADTAAGHQSTVGCSHTGATPSMSFYFTDNSGNILAQHKLQANVNSGAAVQTLVPSSAVSAVLFPTAGTNVYKLQVQTSGIAVTAFVQYTALIAYEL